MPYLGVVLFPALAVFIVVTVISYRRYALAKKQTDGATS
jgi:hypothetical protein